MRDFTENYKIRKQNGSETEALSYNTYFNFMQVIKRAKMKAVKGLKTYKLASTFDKIR